MPHNNWLLVSVETQCQDSEFQRKKKILIILTEEIFASAQPGKQSFAQDL